MYVCVMIFIMIYVCLSPLQLEIIANVAGETSIHAILKEFRVSKSSKAITLSIRSSMHVHTYMHYSIGRVVIVILPFVTRTHKWSNFLCGLVF